MSQAGIRALMLSLMVCVCLWIVLLTTCLTVEAVRG